MTLDCSVWLTIFSPGIGVTLWQIESGRSSQTYCWWTIGTYLFWV